MLMQQLKMEDIPFSTGFTFLRCKKQINFKYLYYLIRDDFFQNKKDREAVDGIMGGIRKSDLLKIKIPLSPLEIQEQIVTELDSYQKIIDGAKQVVENYKPTFKIDPEWEMIKLEKACNIKTGKLNANAAVKDGRYPFFTCSKEIFKIDEFAFNCEAILLSGNNATGNFDVKYYKGKFNAYQRTYVITIKESYLSKLTYTLLQNTLENSLELLKNQSIGGLTRYLTLNMITSIKIPLPPIHIQHQIVAQITREQKIVNANKELITIFENKVKDKIANIWGE